MSDWGPRGLSGRIGAGPDIGKYVLAELVELEGKRRFRRAVPRTLYVLWLPTDPMTESDGKTRLMDATVVDGERPSGSGGLIDLLTSHLRVDWSSDDAEFERALDWYRTHVW